MNIAARNAGRAVKALNGKIWSKHLTVTGYTISKGRAHIQCVNVRTNRPFTISRWLKSHIMAKLEQTNDTTPRPQLRTKHGKRVTSGQLS